MEATNIEKRPQYTLTESPWYFGAYLNQARHNLFLVLNDLTVKLGFSPMEADDELLGARCKAVTMLRNQHTNPLITEMAMKYYEEKLPFLFLMSYTYLTDEEREKKSKEKDGSRVKNLFDNPDRCYEILELLIKTLNDARNHYSHYTVEPFSFSKRLVILLEYTFDANVRKVKDLFKLNDNQVEHLRRYESWKDKITKRPPRKKDFKSVASCLDIL
jgi:hypothetical protein